LSSNQFGYKTFSAREHPEGAAPPRVNLGPPNTSKTTTAGKLKLKTPFDIVKYWHWVKKFFSAIGGVQRGTWPLT